MADIFTKPNINSLLQNKTIWFWGDSNMRAIYKDFVWLSQRNSLITQSSLAARLEKSFMKDRLLRGSALTKNRAFEEVRHYSSNELKTTLEFMFITKCLNNTIKDILFRIVANETIAPDVLIINSCLWDITRWGPNGAQDYKKCITELMRMLKAGLPPSTLVIWTTTPPLSSKPHGGFFINQIDFMRLTLRFEVMEANMFVRQEVVSHGFDLLDIHYHLLLQIHRRRKDGIHWNPDAVRHMTNLLLTHIALSWGKPLPGNFVSPILDKVINLTPAPVIRDCKETLRELNLLLDGDKAERSDTNYKGQKKRGGAGGSGGRYGQARQTDRVVTLKRMPSNNHNSYNNNNSSHKDNSYNSNNNSYNNNNNSHKDNSYNNNNNSYNNNNSSHKDNSYNSNTNNHDLPGNTSMYSPWQLPFAGSMDNPNWTSFENEDAGKVHPTNSRVITIKKFGSPARRPRRANYFRRDRPY